MKNFRLLLLTFVLGGCAALAQAAPHQFARYQDVASAIGSASNITVSAYTLMPSSPLVDELEQRAARGAHVRLVLTGDGFGYALRQNCEIVTRMTGTRRCEPGTTAARGTLRVTLTSYPLHMKSAVADHAVFVSDTNFSRNGLYLRLGPELEPTVLRAVLDSTGYYGGFTTSKGLSLRVEAALIAGSTAPVLLETESIGDGNPVFYALVDAQRAGRRVTVFANARDYKRSRSEHRALYELRNAGIDVHLINASEKLAIVGSSCWLGSSNASGGLSEQVDFGDRLDDPNSCTFLRSRIDSNARE